MSTLGKGGGWVTPWEGRREGGGREGGKEEASKSGRERETVVGHWSWMITVKYRQNVKGGTLFSSEFYSLSLDLGSGTATQVTTLTSAIPHSAWNGTEYRLLKGPEKHTEKQADGAERGLDAALNWLQTKITDWTAVNLLGLDNDRGNGGRTGPPYKTHPWATGSTFSARCHFPWQV